MLQTLAPDIVIDVPPTLADSMKRMALRHLHLLFGPEPYLSDKHLQERLLTDHHVYVVFRDHPEIGSHMTPEQFYRLVHVVSAFEPARAKSICWRCLNKRGEATRPEMLVQGFATMENLRIVDSPVLLPPMTQFIQWRALFTAEPGHQWLRNLVAEAAHSLDFPKQAGPNR